LLGIIFPLEKFRICIYGLKIIIYMENKSLTFLTGCAVTWNRAARRMVNLQQYDIELRNVKWAHSYLADIFSQNPEGQKATEIRNLTKT